MQLSADTVTSRRFASHGRGRFVPWGALLLGLGCSSSHGTSADSDGTDGGGGRTPVEPVDIPPGEEAPLVGTFNVDRVAPSESVPDGYTSLVGKIYDGPTPAQLVWEQSAAEGDCRLLEPRVPFCETPCGGSAACVEDDVCQDYPTARSAGTVTMTGLETRDGATELSMEPVANTYQPTGGVQLGLDAFAEGDAIGLSATGGDFSPFAIDAKGIALLELDEGEIRMDPGAPIELGWTAPGIADLSEIHVKVDISHHGGTKGKIECDTADDGSLEIPGSLVTELLSLGVSGFPSVTTTRTATGSTRIESGRVDLVIGSQVEREVVIEGLVSCTSDDACPAGQTCQVDLRCE